MERIYSGSENEPKVAVVLPVYNTEKYLRECIDSLLDQEYKNFIIFAVNDGSTDGSKEILLEYARKDTRLIVLDKRNGGVSSARNLALDKIAELANFDFVCFADSDDIVNRQYISAYVDAACKYSADYIVCGWTHFDKSGVNTSKEKYACIPPMEIPPKDVFDHLYKVDKWKKLCTTSTSCFLANRCFSWKVIGESRFDEQLKTGEDQEFLIRLLINVNKGVALNDINYFYRLRRSSLSHEKNVTFEDVLLFLKILDRIDEFPVCAKKSIELRTLEMWWKCVEWTFYSGSYITYKNSLLLIYDRLVSRNYSFRLTFRVRRRFLMYAMGDAFLRSYFIFRKCKAGQDELKYAYD